MCYVSIKIDGKEIKAQKDSFVLDVARENGIEIPSLCYDPSLEKFGGCRLCIVEITNNGWTKIDTSCSTKVKDGMEIKTSSKNLIKKRKGILQLLLDSHPNDCLTCQKAGECLLQKYAYDYDVNFRDIDGEKREKFYDLSSPYIMKDNAKCILCGKCVSICGQIEDRSILSFANRGYDTYIACDLGEDFAHSYCISCNRCVSICPVGALTDKRILGKVRSFDADKKTVKCKVCEFGCDFEIYSKNGNNIAVIAKKPSDGRPLCLKGRMMTELLYLDNPDTPYIKTSGEFIESDWITVIGFKNVFKKISKLEKKNEGE
ncbi:(2Fe-2S)-binding protein [Anaerococcus sp. AGMB00486]|uniref:(2Fe-2S)-binding protein n=1 Tax=Anaerococcus faecalis TaxID=2742993 RepID=A0ABX2N9U0_9FIRM|nr:2Fe-2S iron-sulfur cluster-binding protein [Anaerococcus faecalis]NVF11413.1 (2Fe-2S)-binding protein [Anaerococcus faecalis]